MSGSRPTPQAIQQLYWDIANNPGKRSYVQVHALDSLSRLHDLFPRTQRPGFFAHEPEPEPLEPGRAILRMSDEEIDALIEREEAEAAAKAKAEAESGDEDDEESNPDEDKPP